MKKVALLIGLAILLAAVAVAQRGNDPDVPVLKRRPAPEQDSQDTPSQSDSTASTPQEPTERPADSNDAETNEPQPPFPRSDSGRNNGQARRRGDNGGGSRGDSASNGRRDSSLQGSRIDLGFDRQQATPEFRLTRGGGVIRVTANDAEDTDQAGQIAVRMRELAARYKRGDGVATQLRDLRGKITYTAHSIEDGAELIISSQDQKAVTAIHQFLEREQRSQPDDDPSSARR